jgi:ribosome-interacting GTPase 1
LKGAKIQVLDLPGIIEGAKDGKGRGRQVISTARTCNVILIVLDAAKPATHKGIIEKELEGFAIRLNKQPPNIRFKKKDKGGINLQIPVSQTKGVDLAVVTSVLKEYRISCADVVLRQDVTIDEIIDVVESSMGQAGKRAYVPCIYVLNKIDSITIEELDLIDQLPHNVPISAKDDWNFEDMLDLIWQYARMLRVYTKPKGQIPDYTAPVVLHADKPSMEFFCNRIHRGILANFNYAWVWGTSVRHQPMKVGRAHILEDEDVVQIVKK